MFKINSIGLKLILILATFNLNLLAQTYSYQIILNTGATGTKSGNISATGAAFHQLTWNGTGTVATCSIKVDSSANGVTWNNGDIIAAQACTTNGQAISTSHVVNFIRINLTTLTGTAERLNAVLNGYASLPSGGGTVIGSSLTSGDVITGAGGVNIQASGLALTQVSRLNPTTTQTVDQSGSTGGSIWQNFACTSLNSETTNNASCTTPWNYIVVKSVGTTAANLRKALNIYFETNLQQGAETDGLQLRCNAVLDANSNATSSNLFCNDIGFGVVGNNITVANVAGINLRPRFSGSGTVTQWTNITNVSVNFGSAGNTITSLNGIIMNSNAPGTTIGNSTAYSSNASSNTWVYGAFFGGTTAAIVASDANVQGRICHGVGSGSAGATLHDCFVGGNNTPEAAVTANVGSIFARQNGAANTAAYVKETGTSNTGWAPILTSSSWAAPGTIGSGTPSTGAFTTLTGTTHKTTTNCAASGTVANPSVVTCSSASAGAVYCDVAASAGTCTVNTTAVTANSRIFITLNGADNTELSKTCNIATITVTPVEYYATKVANTSFTINMPTLTTNGACFEYFIVN